MRVLLDGDTVWLHGKFPGKVHRTPKGGIKFRSGVIHHVSDCWLKLQDILWEESRQRWYTMDPKARPIRARPTIVSLETREEIASLLRNGMSIRAVALQCGLSTAIVTKIGREDSAEFWEGK